MRYLITFSYDGSNFNGYQKQKDVRTVQEELEEALAKINNDSVKVVASGRTDAGVHALNQTAHFDLKIKIDAEKLKKALNSLLPKDTYIKKAEVKSADFHARYNVKKKMYIYKINIGEYNPLERSYVYQYNRPLNIDKMKESLKLLEGTHDFRSFGKASSIKKDYMRTIYKTNLVLKKDIITISFTGSGFLRYMVRNMVGTLIEIGEGKELNINKILESKNRTEAGKTAKPEGLYLKKVYY